MPRSLRSFDPASRQFEHFTNRHQELDALQGVLDLAEGKPLPVLMFWGVGGNGKSWLLRKLREALPPALPSALLDFEPLTGGTPYHADSSRALAELRRQMASVAFPRFDLAYAWLRHKEGVTDEPLLKGGGPTAKVFDFITEAAPSLAEGVPLVGWLLRQAAAQTKKHLKETRLEAWLAAQVGQEDFQRLRRATTQDLYPELANRFLRDAAANLPPRAGKACRGVLFLDTFEALRLGVPGPAQAHAREEWVRNLYALDSPLLLVLAGRDQLRWDELDPGFANPAYLQQHLVGGLSARDARDFLRKHGITDPLLQDAVLRVSIDLETASEGAEPGYHPFSLGLCVDAIREETARGRVVDPASFDMTPGDAAQLAQRFLKSLGDPAHELWVRRLALAPRFDETAARRAFSPATDVVQDAAWEALQGYSFVRDTDAPGWWTLHARMRGALSGHSSAPDNHRFWVDCWRGRSGSETDAFAALTWYHHYCLMPAQARDEWAALAEQLHGERRMAEHYALLSWWEPTNLLTEPPHTPDVGASLVALGIEHVEASLGNRGANLRQAIACYQAALRVCTENAFPQDWAMTQNNLGNAYGSLPAGDRGANLDKAIACYQAALVVYTKTDFPQQWAMTQNNLGDAYSILPAGDRGANLRQAIACFEAALRFYTETDFPLDWAATQNNLGVTYSILPAGDQSANLRQAIACFENALRIRTETDFPQAWAMTQNNLGIAYKNLLAVDQSANLRQTAIDCFKAAERGFRLVRMLDAAANAKRQADALR